MCVLPLGLKQCVVQRLRSSPGAAHAQTDTRVSEAAQAAGDPRLHGRKLKEGTWGKYPGSVGKGKYMDTWMYKEGKALGKLPGFPGTGDINGYMDVKTGRDMEKVPGFPGVGRIYLRVYGCMSRRAYGGK